MKIPQDNIGCAIAQRITSSLLLMGIPYQKIADIVYGECSSITNEQSLGDWLEMPDGTTYTLTFKPTPSKKV